MPCRFSLPRATVCLLALVCLAPAVHAAGHFTTANFVITAPNDQIARRVGEYAERWRREKAMEWLGREMPQWGRPCPLKVTITANGSAGETTFAFDQGTILDQQMHVEGTLERVLDSVLPHEITHTVFAYRFRQPLPRWADEGGSVLSEDEHERSKHDDLIRRFLSRGNQAYRLRVLMQMMRYPTTGEDVITLYAEGYSLVRFLVESSNKRVFLDFIADGMQPEFGWDRALQKHYQCQSIEDLEGAWLRWMKDWYSPQARLMKQGDSHVSSAVAATTNAVGQSESARATIPQTPISNLAPRRTELDRRAAPADTGDRPWPAVGNAPSPAPASNPGWKPVQARLGSAVPLPD